MSTINATNIKNAASSVTNIILDTSGGITTAGKIQSGGESYGNAQGVVIGNDGYIRVTYTGSNDIFRGYELGNTLSTSRITADGSAEFEGTLTSGPLTVHRGDADKTNVIEASSAGNVVFGTGNTVIISDGKVTASGNIVTTPSGNPIGITTSEVGFTAYSGGGIYSARSSGSDPVFYGLLNDGNGHTSRIDADGSARFEGSITAASGGAVLGIQANTTSSGALQLLDDNDDVGIDMAGTGSASFAGNITINNGGTYETAIIADTTRDRISYTNPNANVITMFSNDFGNGVSLDGNASSWGSYSQRSLKTDLIAITDGLNKVAGLSGVIGRYKTDAEGTKRAFLIADEVKEVLPEAVSGTGTIKDPLTLRYTEVIPLLVSALHDAKDRIEDLEAEVAALKS